MNKILHSDDCEALLRENSGVMSDLINYDARIKSAKSDILTRGILDQYKPDKDHFAVHMIALGDEEHFGMNKNADSFPKLACEKYYDTFVKNGHMFREHKHKSPELKIGDVKYACYNPRQGRIELIGHYNIKKAEDIYESVKSGNARAYSMSCSVPNDTCACCDHDARTPADYCEYMKNRPGQYIAELRKYAFVRNHKPKFFDISDVKNNADRIAHYLDFRFGDDDMAKAAAVSKPPIILGTDWAEFNGISSAGDERQDFGQHHSMLEKLAAQEEWASAALLGYWTGPRADFLKSAAAHILSDEMSQEELNATRSLRPMTFFGELAKSASILPFHSFLAYALNRPIADVQADPAVKTAAAMLPGIFGRILDGAGIIPKDIDTFAAGDRGYLNVDHNLRGDAQAHMNKVAARCSLQDQTVKSRVLASVITKHASTLLPAKTIEHANKLWADADNSMATSYAGIYGAYKVAALSAMQEMRSDIFDDNKIFLASAHNHFAE